MPKYVQVQLHTYMIYEWKSHVTTDRSISLLLLIVKVGWVSTFICSLCACSSERTTFLLHTVTTHSPESPTR